MKTLRWCLSWLVALGLLVSTAGAELPVIRFDRLQPLGGAVGSTIEVEAKGKDAEEVKALLFDHPGLKAEFVKDQRFKITVAADVPAGTYDVRLVGRFGVSNPRLFSVSRGLVELSDQEPNNTPDKAQPIELNAVVNGASDSNGQDVFRLALAKGKRVTIECEAGKLDSDLDATLIVTAADGRILATNSDYFGRDPFVDFIAPEAGEYLLIVHDLSYRGGLPYRLVVTDQPHVENIYPRVVEVGKTVELTAYGRNFGTAGKPSSLAIDGQKLDEYKFNYTPPADSLTRGGYSFSAHPTDHSVLPTAATCTLVGEQLRVPIGPGALRPQPIMFSSTSVTLDREPNDDSAKPQELTLPVALSGRFDSPRDADWFTFVAPDNGSYSIEVYSERIGGRADPFVVVVDEKDNRVSELDDFGTRSQAFDGHLRDPVGSVNLKKGERYRLLVQDRYSRGGARYQYVLTVRQPVSDFFVAAIHRENQEPAGLNVLRGGATHIDLFVQPRDGYNGPITITAEGLPKGVHCVPTHLLNDTRSGLVVWADADAPEWTGLIRLFAVGQRGDETLRHEVRPHTKVWNNQNMNSSRAMRDLALGVRDAAPFSLRFEPAELTAEQGSKPDVKVKAERIAADFKAEIKLQSVGNLPGNIKLADATINSSQPERVVSLDLSAARPGVYTFFVQGQAQVPFSKEADAKSRPNTLVTLPSRPITVTVTAKSAAK